MIDVSGTLWIVVTQLIQTPDGLLSAPMTLESWVTTSWGADCHPEIRPHSHHVKVAPNIHTKSLHRALLSDGGHESAL